MGSLLASEVQDRAGQGCVPRKAHTEAEWTVHPTCSLSSPFPSDSESKTSIVKVIRSILRENFRRHIKCELPLEKTCKDRLVPLKNRVPVSAKLGENFISSVLMKKTCPLPQSSHSSIKHRLQPHSFFYHLA